MTTGLAGANPNGAAMRVARDLTVVKIGGRPQADPDLPAVLAAHWAAAPRALVIVHGGGDEISALQALRGVAPTFVGGRRVTTAEDLAIVRMALSGTANKRLVAALRAAGAPAVGVSGEDGGLVQATPLDPDTFGFVGTPAHVEPRLLETLLAAEYLPVCSPVAAHADVARATALNVNGDDAAAAIAAALGAQELFFLADVPAVLDAEKQPIGVVTAADAARLVAEGVAVGGMAAKLEAALRAVHAGVAQVRIGDREALGERRRGTTVRAV